MEVSEVLLEKARFESALGLEATQLTLHPYLWHAFETQLRRMELEPGTDKIAVHKVEVEGGKAVTYVEGLLVCLDPEFPILSILVS